MGLAHELSAANRRCKWDLFIQEFRPTPKLRVLDVGFSATEHSPSDNYIEKHYPYPEHLVALGVDPVEALVARYPKVKAIQYDGVTFPFGDGEFDVCWSNAVIEHVGDFDRQVAFVRELARVGNRLFFTTPNRAFPIEVHTRTPFLHWLPRPAFDRYLRLVGRGWAAGDYMHLLDEKRLRAVLAQAGVSGYRLVKNRLLGMTMDFVVIADRR